MPETFKILGQALPVAATETLLYQCPATAQAVCSCIVVCNQNGTAEFRVRVKPAGAAYLDRQFIYYDTVIGPFDTIATVIGITLGALDTVEVTSSSGAISFTLFGTQIT